MLKFEVIRFLWPDPEILHIGQSCLDVSNDQIDGNSVVSATWDDDVRIFFGLFLSFSDFKN